MTSMVEFRRGPVPLLFCVQLISMGAMEMSGPFWPIHLRTLTTSDTLWGVACILVYVGPMAGLMFTGPYWGRIGDRYGHKWMMVRALSGLAVTQWALVYASDIATVLLLRLAQGACAGYIAPAQAYGVGAVAKSQRTRLFAVLQIATNVGSLGGALAGGIVLDHGAFSWINGSAAIICALCAVTVLVALPALHPVVPSASENEPPVPDLRLLHVPVLPMLLSLLGILFFARLLPNTVFAPYMDDVFGASHTTTGLCYGLMAVGFIVSATSWSRYFDRFDTRAKLDRLLAVVAGCGMLMVLACLIRDAGWFLAVYFCWGVLLAATTPVLMSLISKTAPDQQQGQVLGMAQRFQQFSSISGIGAGMLLSQYFGLIHLYAFVAIAYGIAWLMMGWVRIRMATPQESAALVSPGEG